MQQEAVPVWLIVVIFIPVFFLFWCFVIWLISHFSGWQRLAQRYRSLQLPSGDVWSWQYGMVGWVGYNGVLTLTANDQGLFMEVLFLFKVGHSPLFISWHEFHEAKVVNYFFRRQVKAKVGFPTVATVHLPAAVFEESAGRALIAKG